MELDKILKKHNLKENFVKGKESDDENRIFISDNYVVKLYYQKKFHYYFNELKVYKGLENKSYLPKMYFYGEEEDYKYIIMSRLKGKSLFDSWDLLDYDQKCDAISQIAVILKDINEIEIKLVDFRKELCTKFNDAIKKLDFSNDFIDYLKFLYKKEEKYLLDKELGQLIHIDAHFYNFLFNEGKVYAYDFENLMLAPLDYQLVRWYKMWKYPEKFFYPKDSLTRIQIESYKMLMPILLQKYPEIYSNNNFDDRVKLYILIYLLEEANRCHLSEDDVKKYINENIKVKLKGKE